MTKINQGWLNAANLLSDAALTFIAYIIAIWIRFDLLGGNWSVDMMSEQFVLIILGYCLVIVGVYYYLQIYSQRKYERTWDAMLMIITANMVCTLLLSALLFFLKESDFSRGAIVLFFGISSFLVISKHVVYRLVLSYVYKKGFNIKQIVVIGDGMLAEQYATNIKKNPNYGICVKGYVSDNECKNIESKLGGYQELASILESNNIDEVVIALDYFDDNLVKSIIASSYKEGIKVNIIPSYNDYIPSNPTIDVVGNTKLINLNASPLDNIILAAMKRIMDIVISVAGIIIFSPIMLFAAIGVKLSSPGPIFFKQDRVGKNKKVFKMLKFRSMRVNAKENSGWSTNSDPRKTAFGSFIRKTSIDELPQLFNVLLGQMSLVGPRPEVPFHVGHFKEEIPQYLVRQQVRPGITGWAQINGLRGDTSIEERVKYDLWYIDNWTLRLDIEILIKTALGGFINAEKVITK